MAPPHASSEDVRVDFLIDGPKRSKHTLILAHGAGTPMDHAWMTTIAQLIAAEGVRVARFEFPYMAGRRTGGRRPPDREPALREAWLEAIEALGGGAKVAISGKSMGGRIASLVADEAGVRALVCLGYPFHPIGRPEQLRTAHLATLRTRTLIVQGERDAFGTHDEVAQYALSEAIHIAWMPDGDHSLTPRKASGHTAAEHLQTAAGLVGEFVRSLA